MKYVLLLIFCLGLLAVVLLNDIKYAMLIIVPLVLALLDLFIVNPYLHKKRDEVNEAESEIDSLNDFSQLKNIHWFYPYNPPLSHTLHYTIFP